MDDAEFMRDAWINTFVEMKQHMKPEVAHNVYSFGDPYGFGGDEDEIEIDASEQNKQKYKCVLPCGQVRNNCSFNAACNTQLTEYKEVVYK